MKTRTAPSGGTRADLASLGALDQGGAAPRRRAEGPGLKSAVLAVLIFVVLVAAWQGAASAELVSPLILAPPGEVIEVLVRLAVIDGTLWPNLLATVQETLLGFALAVAAAVVLGSVFAFSPILRNAVYPYILASQTFPKVAIAPLIVAAMGYGLAPKVTLAALLAFFPVLTNTIAGLTEVSEDEVNLFRALRASRWQELRYLRIPNALAFIFPALNSAAVLALIGAIVGEFVAAREGVGYAIAQYTVTGEVAATYAMLIALSIFGLAVYGVLSLAERLVRRAQ
ncbi:NitT/TauT family transport system permease protein [Thermocatellispora tengchongensis]|uniref:NitT/TauT family transport system permease protein n=1 Tax=Thermocatellispora tengchongensis TaxID=1073253 RepID=A0A840PKR1_9ACTN|nr:ABC transporter permease [Thermocatellispora tengchongensis]MBB5136645.1 NitT/TauT family transport system permease protein [Thermocatellispora tengchongensis]